MRQTTKDLNKLKENDLINILLFSLYKLSSDPEYAAISELIYCLDKDSFYKLCATYGGCTIKIPTLSELKLLTNVLLLIQLTNEGISFSDGCKQLNIDVDKKEVLKMYTSINSIIEEYYDGK